MMPSSIRGDAAFARPFDPIRDIEFAAENILTSASFSSSSSPALPPPPPEPLLQIAIDGLIGILLKEGKP